MSWGNVGFFIWWKIFIWMEVVLLIFGVKSRQEMSLWNLRSFI